MSKFDLNIYNVINFIYLLTSITDYNKMSLLLGMAYRKSYIEFIQEILALIKLPLPTAVKSESEIARKININIIDNCLFVVKDLNLFLETVRETNKHFVLSVESKNIRGQVNSINNFLSLLDMDFRDSLFNHYICHKNLWRWGGHADLTRPQFSFKNIHMRLGNIKYYSTNI